MVQSASDGVVRALDQARRPRVAKPADQRRRDILASATELFRKRGFDATTVQAIAAEAGVAAGTVYLHFPSKDAVLSALQQDFEAGLLDRFADIAAEVVEVVEEEVASGGVVSNPEIVGRLVDGIVDYGLSRRAACEVIARHAGRVLPDVPALASGLTELLSRVISEGVRIGHVHTSDPEMAAYLLNQAAVGAIAHAIAFDNDAALTRVVAAVKELYTKALAPQH